MMKVYTETYGCTANQNHGEIMKGLIERSGCKNTSNDEMADVVIINTCIVKSPTENRIMNRIKELAEKNLEEKLIIAGCMPMVEYEKIKEIAPKASLLGTNNCKDITNALTKIQKGNRIELVEERREEKLGLPKVRKNKYTNICEISQGCLGDCNYCQVKMAKGDLRSYKPEKIASDIKKSLESGCKQIWLTSQDNGCYGYDIDTDLVQLLKKIIGFPGNYRIRIGMMNVNTINNIDELIEIYKSEKIYSFLHIPVQSGSDEILKKMNRKYTVNSFKQVVNKFKEKIPNLNLWTDIIVGYPDETESQFKQSIELIKGIQPDNVNVSRFEPRPGTKAKQEKQLPTKVKKKRSEEMAKLVRKIKLERKKKMVGKTKKVLITERGLRKNQWKGRDGSYRNVLVRSEKNIEGKFVNVEIKGAIRSGLIGEVKQT